MSARIDLDGSGFIGGSLVRRWRTAALAQDPPAAQQDPAAPGAPMTILFTKPAPSLISRERLDTRATR